MWDPLRQYQTKLEKLLAKAAAEQLAAEKKTDAAARAQEQDVDMQSAPDAEGRDTTTAAAPADDEGPVEKPVEHVIGKKRLASPEEEEEEEERDECDSQNGHNTEEQRSTPSDNDSESSFRSLTVKSKETKRMRVA